MRLAVEAYNRRDLQAVAIGFHPELEYYPYRQFVEAGLAEPCYHGPAGYRAYITATYDVWGTEVRLYPTELIDLATGSCCSPTCRCAHRAAASRWLRHTPWSRPSKAGRWSVSATSSTKRKPSRRWGCRSRITGMTLAAKVVWTVLGILLALMLLGALSLTLIQPAN
jgi:hypothetical protein